MRDARDVVVVGAGPAGAAVSIFLKQRGHDVLLIDEARFPRDKICCESVSPEGWRLLRALGAAVRIQDLRHWEGDANGSWVIDKGMYTVLVGKSGADADLTQMGTFTID